MKKNKGISLVIIILVIIGIIFCISRIINKKNDQTQKLSKIYEDLNSSQTYQFEWEQNNSNKTIIARDEDKTLIDQYSKED